MSIIWTLRQRLHRLRKKQGLPPVADLNDIEDPKEQDDYVSVLSDKERASLKYQQEMFAKSQVSWLVRFLHICSFDLCSTSESRL